MPWLSFLRSVRWRAFALALALAPLVLPLLLAPAGCSRCSSGSAEGAGDGGDAAGPAPAAAAPGALGAGVVATFGERQVRIEDVQAALSLAQFIALRRTGNPLPAGQLADKSFRRGLVLDLIDRRLIRAEATRLALEIPESDRQEEQARDPGDGSLAWKTLIEDRLLARALARHLLGPLDDERLRREYFLQHDKIEVRTVRVPRTPTSEEVDRFLAERPADVEAYYAEKRSEFRTPLRRTVRYLGLPVPEGASAEQQAALQRQAEELRAQVQSGQAKMVDLVRRHSGHPSRERDGLVGPVQREELPAAFAVGVGKVSRVYHDLRSFYFVEVLSVQEPADRRLDDALRREVAARAVVAKHANRHAWELAEAIRRGMAGQEPLGPLLQANGLHVQNTGLFPRGQGNHLPGIGLVPSALIDRLFAAQPMAPPEPVQEVGADLLVLQVIRRQAPDWNEYEKEKDGLPAQLLARSSRETLTRWLAASPERHAVIIDYAALMDVPPPPDR